MVIRGLFSILEIDIAGYTELCEKRDPEHVFEIVSRFFRKGEEAVNKFYGNVISKEGDKLIAAFGLNKCCMVGPLCAVKTALKIEKEMHDFDSSLLFHSVVTEGVGRIEEVDGRCNISGEVLRRADELENLSEPGEFLVSSHIAHELATVFNFKKQNSECYSLKNERNWNKEVNSNCKIITDAEKILVMGPKLSGKSSAIRNFLQNRNPDESIIFLDAVDGIRNIKQTLKDKNDCHYIIENYGFIDKNLDGETRALIDDTVHLIMESRELPSYLPKNTAIVKMGDVGAGLLNEINFLREEINNFDTGIIQWRLMKNYFQKYPDETMDLIQRMSVYPQEIPVKSFLKFPRELIEEGIIKEYDDSLYFTDREIREYILNTMNKRARERNTMRAIFELEELGKDEEIVSLYCEIEEKEKAVAQVRKIVRNYLKKGQVNTALKWVERGIKITGENENLLLPLLKMKKECYKRKGKYRKASSILKEISNVVETEKDKIGIIIENTGLYISRGEYKKALNEIKKTENFRGKDIFEKYKFEVKIKYVEIYENTLKFKNALKILDEIIKEIDEKDIDRKTDIYLHKCQIYWNTGKLHLAERVVRKAIEENMKAGNEKQLARLNLNLGNTEFYRSHFDESLKYYKDALNLLGEEKLNIRATLLSNIGGVYQYKGEYLKSINYFKRALSFDRDFGNRKGEAVRLNNMGSAYAFLGLFDKAKVNFEKAVKIDREIGNVRGELTKMGNLGGVLFNMGNRKEAIKVLEEVIRRSEEEAMLLNIAYFKIQLAPWYSKKNPEYSINLLTDAIKICRREGIYGYLVAGFTRLAEVYFSMGKKRKARGYARKAVKWLKKVEETEFDEIEIYHSIYSIMDDKRYFNFLEKAYKKVMEISNSLDKESRKIFLNKPVNMEVLKSWEENRVKEG